jgi:hypothetical protein
MFSEENFASVFMVEDETEGCDTQKRFSVFMGVFVSCERGLS